MPVLLKLRHFIYRHFKAFGWQTVLVMIALYSASSWLLLVLAREQALTGADFLYWLVVTASTVGYGDLSPQTPLGKLVTALYIIPFGLSIFALSAGKVAAFSAFQWRKGIMGLKQLNLNNHILVVGWNEQRTQALLQLLKTETSQYRNRTICLYVDEEMENPLPGVVEFVRAAGLTDQSSLDRACAAQASTIIIDCARDDQTLSCALNLYPLNQQAHIIAYFRDEQLSRLLKQHCPGIECTPSVSTEMLVKSAMDPGSSILHHELLNAETGMTQYAVQVPQDIGPLTVADLYQPFKTRYGATLIAVDLDNDGRPDVNPDLQHPIQPGCMLYYIAKQRLNAIDWPGLTNRSASALP